MLFLPRRAHEECLGRFGKTSRRPPTIWRSPWLASSPLSSRRATDDFECLEYAVAGLAAALNEVGKMGPDLALISPDRAPQSCPLATIYSGGASNAKPMPNIH
jgi:hypothetical protein